MDAKENGKINVCNYMVAFIDILSQKEALKKLVGLPPSGKADEEFLNTLRSTLGVVRGFRNAFNSFRSSATAFEEGQAISPEMRDYLTQMRRDDLTIQTLSDAVVISAPLARDLPIPVNSIFYTLRACAAVKIITLAAKQALRGGIDLGVGAEMPEGDVYGSGLSNAYSLETQVADYPRIVVGDNVVNYLDEILKMEGVQGILGYSKKMAENSRNLLAVDIDGRYIVDYLGSGYKSQIPSALTENLMSTIIPTAYDWITEQQKRFRNEKNTKLAFKYAHLRRYFDANLEIWK